MRCQNISSDISSYSSYLPLFTESSFLIANAQTTHQPIIYCSHEFSEETGYSRDEVTSKDVSLYFLHGSQTNREAISLFEKAVRNKESIQLQMILYGKTGINF